MKRIVLTFSILVLAACAANRPIPDQQPLRTVPAANVEAEPGSSLNAAAPNGGNSPLYSPDGRKIAFISSTMHTPADLWTMNADGSGAAKLTARGAKGFRWSEDGKSIIFVANRKGYDEVLTIGIDGGEEKRVEGLPPNASLPDQSPDGSLFAFTAPDSAGVRSLWIGTSDGKRIEPVTDKISVRSFFWDKESRRVYYEAGKTYGVGLWSIDLATMEVGTLVNKYIGTPAYSSNSDLIAFPYPTNPGVFEVHVIKRDGSDEKVYQVPRLQGRSVRWDAEGKGLYYVAQDFATEGEQKKPENAPAPEAAPPHKPAVEKAARGEILSLWHFDLATGAERRVTPENFHLLEYSLSPDGKTIICAGLREKSIGTEIFSFDPHSGGLTQLTTSRFSEWKPVPSPDSTRIAFFTNEVEGVDTLRVVTPAGEETASYPGLDQGLQGHIEWLPESDGFVVFSGTGMWAFSEKESVQFAKDTQFRDILYANTSIQEDKIIVSAIPLYGKTPGLYLLENIDGTMAVKDLRFPAPPDPPSEVYLQPRWSLDGNKIAFSDGIDIWVMKEDGTGRTWITNYAENNRDGKGKPSLATFPVWSTRGDKLCYTLTVYDGTKAFRQLWVINADGTGNRMLYSEEADSAIQVHLPEFTNQPFFDFEDERVIFTAVENGVPNIASVGIEDGKVQRLTEKGGIYPVLLPEEALIFYTSLEDNNERLWTMNSDGSGKRPLAVKLKPPVAKPVETKPAAAAVGEEKKGEAKQDDSVKSPEPQAAEAGKEAAKPSVKVKKKKSAKKKTMKQ